MHRHVKLDKVNMIAESQCPCFLECRWRRQASWNQRSDHLPARSPQQNTLYVHIELSCMLDFGSVWQCHPPLRFCSCYPPSKLICKPCHVRTVRLLALVFCPPFFEQAGRCRLKRITSRLTLHSDACTGRTRYHALWPHARMHQSYLLGASTDIIMICSVNGRSYVRAFVWYLLCVCMGRYS